MVSAFQNKQGSLRDATDQKCRCGSLDTKSHHLTCDSNKSRPQHELEAQDDKTNLDSGYAWFILLIMFLLQSSISGASRVYGIVYAKEVSIGYYDREQASWPIATASAVENLASILTPALASFLSWRQIELLSTSLFICSNLLAYFSSSLALDIVALGLIQGLALSTCTVLSLVINNDYFERFRTTAYGIQMSGSTFGVLYLSPLVSWLLAEYEDFRVVYLALAIVFCANIFLVLFIKPRAKTINRGQRGASSWTLGRHSSGAHELEIQRVEKFLESLDREQKFANDGPACNQLQVPLTRKPSRFELHFERKNSIASISYDARSRRQSIYSRQRVSVSPDPSSNPIYTLDRGVSRGQDASRWPVAATDKNMIIKSESGVDLCSKLSGRAPTESADGVGATAVDGKQSAREQRISLDQRRSSPLTVDANQQLSGLHQELRRGVDLSVTNSQASRLDDQWRRPPFDDRPLNTSNGRAGNTDDLNDSESGSVGQKARANNVDVTNLGSGATEPHDLLSSPAMLIQNQQLYLNTRAETNVANQSDKLPKEGQEQPFESDEGSFSMERTVRLLKLPYLHCTWMMLALYYLIARVFVIILVDFADDHGFTVSESTYLLNYWSLGELVGRILLGSIIDLQYLSCKNCIVLTCSLLAASILCMVMVESYIVYAVCSMCIAALISLEYMLINVLMVEYIGKEHVTNCYSLAAGISSLVLFTRPSLIGLFRDHLGSYDGLLILLASLPLVLSVVFYVLEPILVRWWPKGQVFKVRDENFGPRS